MASNMVKYKCIFSVIVLVFISMSMTGQHFEAGVVIGMNTSQIDGDQLYGYNKPGAQLGLSLTYPYKYGIDLRMEMVYCQRGSQDGFSFGGSDQEKLRTSLNYISMPAIVTFKFLDKSTTNDHKLKIYPGIAYSYLVNASTPGNSNQDINNFKKSDFSYLVGLSYALSQTVWIGMRYTRGIDGVIKIPSRNEDALISYFLSFRIEIEI